MGFLQGQGLRQSKYHCEGGAGQGALWHLQQKTSEVDILCVTMGVS